MAIESDETAPLSQTLNPMSFSINTSYEGPHPHPSGALDDAEQEEGLFVPGMLPMNFVVAAVEGFKVSTSFCKFCNCKPPVFVSHHYPCFARTRTTNSSTSGTSPVF